MKRTIYVAKSTTLFGDPFTLIVTFDEAEARSAIEKDINRLSESVKKLYPHWLEFNFVEVDDGESAEDAYYRLLSEDEWYYPY